LEVRARFAESDVARRLFALEATDQAVLSELLERVLAIRPESDADGSSDGTDELELVVAGPEAGR
jgi:hypothetical protein